jgi:TIR domain
VPGRIFISYRREETAYPAGWLYDRLADRFGAGQVFKDVDSIQLGDDFVEVITEAVGSCDVLLVLIGEEWLRITDEHGGRRLDDPDDFVRLEIEAALARKVRVIPILVDGARMPRADELPGSLARLVRRQYLELSPSRFEFDTSRLLRVLDWTLAEARTAHDDAGPKIAAEEKAPGPSATGAQNVAERSGEAGPDRTGSIAPAVPGTPSGDQPPPGQGKPAGGWRRSLQARVLVGAGAGAALILLAVAIIVVLSATRAPNDNAPGGQGAAAAACINVPPGPAISNGIKLTSLEAVNGNCPVKPGTR